MTFDQQLRDLIRAQLERAVAPLAQQVAELQRGGVLQAKLRDLLSGAGARPAKRASSKVAARSPRKATRPAGGPAKDATPCAILGCPRPSRSKGYCSAHYQKRRNLVKTRRLPSDWTVDAAPGTVKDFVLPRGLAAMRAAVRAPKSES